MQRSEVVQGILNCIPEANYLEIGVDSGITFHELKARRKVAVDPHFKFDQQEAAQRHPNCEYHAVTSDAFFGNLGSGEKFDVIYVDGLHTFEQTLRDLLNSIAHLADGGAVIIDDVLPSSYSASLPDLEEAFALKRYFDPEIKDASWMGDVYKLVFFISTFLQKFSFATVMENHGQLIMWRETRSEPAHSQRTIEWISRLEFAALLRNLDEMRLRPYHEIVAAYLAAKDPAPKPATQSVSAAPRRFSTVITKAQYKPSGFYGNPLLLNEPSRMIEENFSSRTIYPATSYHRSNPAYLEAPHAGITGSLTQVFSGIRGAYDQLAPIVLAQLGRARIKRHVIYLGECPTFTMLFQTYRPIDRPYTAEAGDDELEHFAHVFSKPGQSYCYIGSVGSENYGHWLVDDLPRALIAQENTSERLHWIIPASGGAMDQVKADSLKAVLGEDVHFTLVDPSDTVRCERLVYTSPISHHPVLKSPIALRNLKQRVCAPSVTSGSKRLFIGRASNGYRHITNWDDVAPLLAEADFEVINPGAMSFKAQVEAFSQASAVVGVMGAAMANTLFCRAGMEIGYLAPEGWEEPFFWDLAAAMDQTYSCLFGRREPDGDTPYLSSFSLEPDALRRFLQRF
jgi:hypothetical protein